MKKVELLAPAGNAEGFYGAVHGGADAVYLAGNRYGARAYAENFTSEDLVKCIRYGHLLGRKVYLAVNTLLKPSELEELYEYLYPFYEEGIDGVIVQDLGVLRLIRENFPGLKIHISTQMTLCSHYGISLLQEMGAARVVPARELSLKELVAIKKALPSMELECFIHGAMCYCYSGQCLFSSVLGGRSGNRGRCAQPCRLPYTVDLGKDGTESGYVLSLKDMCTIEHIPRLIEAGIDSFKIEGRMKKPEYAAGTAEIYRRYIDKYYELREQRGAADAAEIYSVDLQDRKALSSLYIRSEIQDGYYFRRNGREMVTLKNPAYSGSDEALLKELQEKYLRQRLKLPVTIKAVFHAGEPARLVLTCAPEKRCRQEKDQEIISCEVTGEVVGKAVKQPISKEDLISRLSRLGDSSFYADSFEVSAGEDCFYPLGKINELRREAVVRLEKKILLAKSYSRGMQGKQLIKDKHEDKHKESVDFASSSETFSFAYAVSVRTIRQLKAVMKWMGKNREAGIRRVYIDGDLLVQDWKESALLCGEIKSCSRCRLYIALPYVLRETDAGYLEEISARAEEAELFAGFLARSMDGIGFAEKHTRMACRTDAGVYVWNRAAEEELASLAEGFCMPYELKAAEQSGQQQKLPCEKIVYGRIPMMITANCLRRTAGKCMRGGKSDGSLSASAAQPGKATDAEERYHTILTDRYHKRFPVIVNCLHCMNILYNSIPFSLYRELPKWREMADLRIEFTTESPMDVERLLDAFIKGAPLPEGEYTAGYEKRGVE